METPYSSMSPRATRSRSLASTRSTARPGTTPLIARAVFIFATRKKPRATIWSPHRPRGADRVVFRRAMSETRSRFDLGHGMRAGGRNGRFACDFEVKVVVLLPRRLMLDDKLTALRIHVGVVIEIVQRVRPDEITGPLPPQNGERQNVAPGSDSVFSEPK